MVIYISRFNYIDWLASFVRILSGWGENCQKWPIGTPFSRVARGRNLKKRGATYFHFKEQSVDLFMQIS
jgi:hypothetical protein